MGGKRAVGWVVWSMHRRQSSAFCYGRRKLRSETVVLLAWAGMKGDWTTHQETNLRLSQALPAAGGIAVEVRLVVGMMLDVGRVPSGQDDPFASEGFRWCTSSPVVIHVPSHSSYAYRFTSPPSSSLHPLHKAFDSIV